MAYQWTKFVVVAAMALFPMNAKSQTTAFLLYGGQNNKTFLGCLNCGKYGTSSVCNEFGTHGSDYANESIWNEFGNYGSEFSSHSPWNEFTSTAPVIVDKDGNFFGHFTANEFHANRARVPLVDDFFKLAKKFKSRSDARKLMCR